MLIDTHCHLNDAAAFPDWPGTLALAQDAGVAEVIVIGVDMESSQRAVTIAAESESAYAVVGWHPNYAANYRPETLAQIEAWLSGPRVVALGEIGLDYHWDYATREQQNQALGDQLDLAERLQVPVVFHCREAYGDLLTLLEARKPRHGMLFHCFAGNAGDRDRALALGAFFGVDGPITYTKADELREVVRGIPLDRLVLETDSPYLSPVPYRGKPNSPSNLPLINEGLGRVFGLDPAETAAYTTQNARRFFGLPT